MPRLSEFTNFIDALSVKDPSDPVPFPKPVKHGVEFKDVDFAYQDNIVLKEFNLRLQPGKVVALSDQVIG